MEKSSGQTSAPTHAYTSPAHSQITNHSNISDFDDNVTYIEGDNYIVYDFSDTIEALGPIADYLILSFVLLGLCFVIYGLHSLVKTDQSSPVFVINLFVSDLIQASAKLIQISTKFLDSSMVTTGDLIRSYMRIIYFVSLMDNICFMVCISAERYVMIAHPVWYRTNQTTRTSIFVSVIIWVISTIVGIFVIITQNYSFYFELVVLVFLLLPYPLVIFFLVGTWRALSRSTSVSHHDQRRIMGMLTLILCIYTVLFIPYIVVEIDFFFYVLKYSIWYYLLHIANILMTLNPLCDFLLYLFTRRDAKDLLCALFLCCHKRHEESPTTVTVPVSHS